MNRARKIRPYCPRFTDVRAFRPRRAFDFGRVNLWATAPRLRDSVAAAWALVHNVGLDTLDGCDPQNLRQK